MNTNVVWVRIHPHNPRSFDHPSIGWVTSDDWKLKDGAAQFREVPVHFKNETVNLHVIILNEVE